MASASKGPAASADPVQNSKNAKKAEMDRANQLAQSAENALNQFRNLNKALTVISEAIAVRPKQARWYTIRAQIYRALGKNQLAFYDYNAALRLEPRSYFNYIGRGLCLRKLRRYNEALLDVETALEAEPGNPVFRYFRATVHQHLEDYNSAVADYGASLGVPGYSLRARVARAACLECLGRVKEALADMEVAVGKGDGSPHPAPFTAYGLLLMQLGRHAEAVQAFSAAVERAGQNPSAYATALDNRAWALFLCGRNKEAQEDLYTAAASLGGDTPVNDPSPPFHRGALALAGGNPVKALPELLRAAEYVEALVRKARRRALGGGGGGSAGEEEGTEGDGEGVAAPAAAGPHTGLTPNPSYYHAASPAVTGGGASSASPSRPGRRAEGMPAGSHFVAVELAFAQDGEGMPPELRPQGRDRHSAAAAAAHAAHVVFPHDEDTDSDTFSDAVRERDTALQEPVRHRRGAAEGAEGAAGAGAGGVGHGATLRGGGGGGGEGGADYGAVDGISDSISLPSGSMAASSIGGRSGGGTGAGGHTRRGNIARNLGKASNKVPTTASSTTATTAQEGSTGTSSGRERAKRPWEMVPSWIRERVWPDQPPPFTIPSTRAAAMTAAQVQAYLGLAYLHLGHAERALHHFNCALSCWEGCIPARYHAGLCLLTLGRYKEADAQLTRVLEETQGVRGEVEVLAPGEQGRERGAGGGGKERKGRRHASGGGFPAPSPTSPTGSPRSPRDPFRDPSSSPTFTSTAASSAAAGMVPQLRLHSSSGRRSGDASPPPPLGAPPVLPSDPAFARSAVIRLGIASVALLPSSPPPMPPSLHLEAAEAAGHTSTVRSTTTVATAATGASGATGATGAGVLSAAMAKAAAEHAHMHAHAAKKGLSAVLLARALARQALGKHAEAAVDFDGSLGLQAELEAAAVAAAAAAAAAGPGATHAHAHGAGAEEDSGPALLCRARSQLALRRVKAALRDAEEAIGSGVNIAPAYDVQGQALAYMGRYEQAAHAFGLALKTLQHAHDAGEGHKAAGSGSGAAMGATPSSTARSLAAAGLRQGAPDYLSRRAEAYRCTGETGEAILDLNQALELRPSDPVLLEQRGQAHFEHGDARAALADYAAALTALGQAQGRGKRGSSSSSLSSSPAAVRARVHYCASIVHASGDGWEAAVSSCSAGLAELASLLGDPKHVHANAPAQGAAEEADDEGEGGRAGRGSPGGGAGAGAGHGDGGVGVGGLSSGLAAALASAAMRIGGPPLSTAPTPTARMGARPGSGSTVRSGVQAPATPAGFNATGVTETPTAGDTPLPNRYAVPPSAVPALMSGRVGTALKNMGAGSGHGGEHAGIRERLAYLGAEAKVGALLHVGAGEGVGLLPMAEGKEGEVGEAERSAKGRYLERLFAFNKSCPEGLVRLRVALQHERAKALQHLGMHGEAVRDFTDVVCSSPGNPHALLRRAVSYAALGLWSAAAADVEACKLLRPGDPRFDLNYAALRGVEGILLCGPGEEPQWPILGLEELQPGVVSGAATTPLVGHALLLALRAQPKPPLPVQAPNSTGILHPFATATT